VVTFYAATTLWVVCACLMYYAEKDDHENVVDGIPMASRYGTIPNSLWYDSHTSANFPILFSRFFHILPFVSPQQTLSITGNLKS
jgi:hypothetical protein